jgi:hypothetical protein
MTVGLEYCEMQKNRDAAKRLASNVLAPPPPISEKAGTGFKSKRIIRECNNTAKPFVFRALLYNPIKTSGVSYE